MKRSPVVHFEMPYKDEKRAVDFYSKVFGWDMNALGPSMNGYILAGTTETVNMQSTQPGEINGGFFPATDENNRHPLVTISVEDIKEAMKMVTDNGGEVLGEPVDIPNVGKYVAIQDSEGNRASILQPTS